MLVSKQPKKFWSLAFSQACNTFSYYGTLTILTLYLIHNFHLNRDDTYILYGAYAVLIYTAPIIGGVIVDRALGGRNTFIFGSLLDISGNLMLMFFNRHLFCLGLAVSVMGAGLFKSSALYLIGNLYQSNETHLKEAGFTWTYLGQNVGATLGPLIYGFAAYHIGWNIGFLFSALGVSLALFFFIISWFHNAHDASPIRSLPQKLSTYCGIFILCALLSIPFYYPVLFHALITAMIGLVLCYLLVVIFRFKGQNRKHLMALLVIELFGIFYFSASMQLGSTVTFFIQQKIEQGRIHLNLPGSVFNSLYDFFVLLLAPFFTYLWYALKRKQMMLFGPIKLFIGIVLAGCGMLSFALAAASHFLLSGIIVGILMLSAGELIITPVIYTLISDYAPESMKGTMMSSWLFCVAIGSYLSTFPAKISQIFPASTLARADFNEFMFSAVFTFITALILLLTLPTIKKMLHS